MKKLISIIFVTILFCHSLIGSVFALNIGWAGTGDDTRKELPPEDWYADAYKFVTKEFIMTTSSSHSTTDQYGHTHSTCSFFGEREVIRAEVATIIHRYDWNEETTSKGHYIYSTCQAFADVPDGKWMTPAVQWAADNGIVNGVGGDSFAPNRTITREEFATIMYRYTEFKNVERDISADISSYPDGGEVSAWAKDAMAWAVGEGLISGKPGGLLAPQDTITRAEVAVIVYRYNNNVLPHRDNKK